MARYATLFGVAALLSLFLVPSVRRLAVRIGAIDQPGERHIHKRPIPSLGGLAIYLSLVASILFAYDFLPSAGLHIVSDIDLFFVLLAGGSFLALVGAIDDVRPLRVRTKLLAQIAAGVIAVVGGVEIGRILGYELGFLSPILTIFWIVAVTNAINLIDGLDGLAAGIGVIICVALFAISIISSNPSGALLFAATAGALVGFLRYNFHPASIFLGDTGSLFLGFLLAVASLDTSHRTSAAVAIAIPILALGVPLADTTLAVLRRVLQAIHVVRLDEEKERYEFFFTGNVPLFTADRAHVHHRLLDLGLTHRRAVVALYGASLACGLAALALVLVRSPDHGLLLAACGLAAFLGVRRLGYGEISILRNGTLLPLFDSPIVSWRLLHVLIDVVSVASAWLLAHLVWADFEWPGVARAHFLETVPLVLFIQSGALAVAGLHRGAFRYTGIGDLSRFFGGVSLAVVAAWTAQIIAGMGELPSTSLLVLDAYFLATFVIGSRISFRLLDHLAKGANGGGRRVLIYGAGNAGMLALREIQGNPALDMRAVGFLDDDASKLRGFLQGVPIHDPADLDELLARRHLDELLIASAKIPEERVVAIAERCESAGIPVRRFRIGWDDVAAGVTAPGRAAGTAA